MGGIMTEWAAIIPFLRFRILCPKKAMAIWGIAAQAVNTPAAEPIMMGGAPSIFRKRGTTA